jgi:hypothetical protein
MTTLDNENFPDLIRALTTSKKVPVCSICMKHLGSAARTDQSGAEDGKRYRRQPSWFKNSLFNHKVTRKEIEKE